jgi:anti-anti-sigma regulatory factor
MRCNGVVSSAAGLVPFGHLGWGYRDRDEFIARAAEYLADGLKINQRMEYVGDGSREALGAELADIGFREGLRSGRIRVTPIDDFYEFTPESDTVDAESTVAEFVAATEQALTDGYSGLRAVIDGTTVARTPEQLDAGARFEYLIDQQMAVLPSSTMCAYSVSTIGNAANELTCLHPFVAEGAVGFRLFAEPDASFVLAGEIDANDNEVFVTTLERVWQLQEPGTLVIDVRDLNFITHHEFYMLDKLARAEQRDVFLRTDQPIVVRLTELLELTNVRLQAALPVRVPQ